MWPDCIGEEAATDDDFSGFTMLSKDKNDDVWCIDPRGVLTLSVSKDAYERLGLVGKELPFKTHADQHGASFH